MDNIQTFGGYLEKDHFFEVQHIVTLIGLEGHIYGDSWTKISLPKLLMLAYYVNDPRNIFRIPRIQNKEKAWIGIDHYPAGATGDKAAEIHEYLHGYFIEDDDVAGTLLVKTVCLCLWDLATDMNGLPFVQGHDDHYAYARRVGQWFCLFLEGHLMKKGITPEQIEFMKECKVAKMKQLQFEEDLKNLAKKIEEEDKERLQREEDAAAAAAAVRQAGFQ